MRLLNAKTFTLHEYLEQDIPPYAILAHRWGDSEVSFQRVNGTRGAAIARASTKISGCCKQAARDGWNYVVRNLAFSKVLKNRVCVWGLMLSQWIDSCCIDKSSSAELSEAM